jgi:UDP-N-acetylglucosamine--N-acetylmuramyl-(pentapeptide) pyrophosphoryl-undecaprenol N-acetylglucosamine transferase
MHRETIVIAGGGTGGHLFPGVAVAQALQQLRPDMRIVFTISGERERRYLGKYPLEVTTISSAPLYRGLNLRILASLAVTLYGFVQSLALMAKVHPLLAIGTGGYVSGPVLLAAYLRKVPGLICEQNIIPGFTNRVLSRLAEISAVSFENTPLAGGTKQVVTGNPIRQECQPWQREKARGYLGLSANRPTILIMGGSQGAHRINQAVCEALKTGFGKKYQFVLQTGEEDYLEVMEAVGKSGVAALVKPFFSEIGAVYGSADMALCRAGGGTFELLSAGLPLVLVPYPFAAGGHQMANANYWAGGGAAVVIKDSELSGATLAKCIDGLIGNRKKLAQMARASRAMAHPQSARRVAELALALARGEN